MDEKVGNTLIQSEEKSESLTNLLMDMIFEKNIYFSFKKDVFNLYDLYFKSLTEDIKDEKSNVAESEPYISSEEFSRKGFISGESWDKTFNIHARIIKADKEFVTCECLIDKENKVFQARSFPAYLFAHLEPLENKKPVLVKIRSKTGASRIDIYDGEKLIDSSLFEIKDKWNLLKDSNLDKPLEL